MNGFEAQRTAARNGIRSAGGEPVLIEDYPSMPVTPRTACLDAIASSDVYLVIVGERGGWTAPSGKLVVEEEYEEARRRGLPIVYFRQDVQRDVEAQRLDRQLSDYVTGVYRRSYHTPKDLEVQVEEALRPLLSEPRDAGSAAVNELQERLQATRGHSAGAYLQVIVAPLRGGEVFDAVDIGGESFRRTALELGHTRAVDLFDFALPKEHSFDAATDTLTIKQRAQGHVLREVQAVITPAGVLDMQVSVSGHRGGGMSTVGAGMVILEGDVESAAARSIAFARELYESADPYQRYARLAWNAALHHQGHQPLLRDPPPGGSFTVPMRVPRPAIAFHAPRVVTRQDLLEPSTLIGDLLTMLRRRFADS